MVLQQLSITIGILIAFWIDYASNYIGGTRCYPDQPYANGVSFNPYTDIGDGPCRQSSAAWRVPFGLQLFPALMLGIGMFFMPYSPRWLVMRGRDSEAREALCRIRRRSDADPLIIEEYIHIKAEVLFEDSRHQEKFGSASGMALEWKEYRDIFSNPSSFRRVFIGSAVMFFQQFMGCNAIIYYAPTIFAQLGLNSNANSLLATGVYGIINCLATFIALALIDKIGRRILLMAGALGTMVSLIAVAGIVGYYNTSLPMHRSAGWLSVAFIYFYDVNFAYSWAPIGWVLPSEIFPLAIRSKGMSITTSATWMCNFIIGLISPRMLETITYGTYIFFAVFCLFAFFFTLFVVPETRGRSLEDMDLAFNDDTAHEDKRRIDIISSTLENTLLGDEFSRPDEGSSTPHSEIMELQFREVS